MRYDGRPVIGTVWEWERYTDKLILHEREVCQRTEKTLLIIERPTYNDSVLLERVIIDRRRRFFDTRDEAVTFKFKELLDSVVYAESDLLSRRSRLERFKQEYLPKIEGSK